MVKNQNITIILIVLAVLVISQSKTFSIGDSGNLGDWDVNSYNSVTKELRIESSNGNANTAGFYGSKKVFQEGVSFLNQADCEEIGFTWITEDSANPHQCVLRDENWFDGLTYESTVMCTHTRGDASPVAYRPGFNGVDLTYDNLRRQNDDFVACNGELVISFVEEEEPECTVDSDCVAGDICENEMCVPDEQTEEPECTVDSDCTTGQTCENQMCVDEDPPVSIPDSPNFIFLIVGAVAAAIGVFFLFFKRPKGRR